MSGRISEVVRVAGAIWAEHRAVIWIVAGYLAAGYLVQVVAVPGTMWGLLDPPTFRAFLGGGFVSFPVVLVGRRWQMRGPDGQRLIGLEGWRAGWRSARRDLLTLPRLARLAFVLILVPLFLCAFARWKLIIHVVQPFAWDTRLSALDQWLHFGHQPWQILQPALGNPGITRLLDFMYAPVLLSALITLVVWQGWTTDRRLRDRFLLSFVLGWILLGTLLATALSSAGPCYYGRVTGLSDPFRGLMTYLEQVGPVSPLTALAIQEWLWSGHTANSGTSFSEISAMPSIHVAMPTLFALAGWQADRRVGWALAGFALLIFLASVHLGWHYAVDGYVGAIGIWLIWILCGRIVARRHRAPLPPGTGS